LMSFARHFCKTGVALHVAGCVKSCARQAESPLTLIAHDGLYDLVTNQTGRDAGISNAQRLDLAAVEGIFGDAKAGNGCELELQ
jgi:precorrin-3B synthase